MGMPEVDGGLSRMGFCESLCAVGQRPGSPRIESRWRSDKLVVTKGEV
jgi:hypothetical protein